MQQIVGSDQLRVLTFVHSCNRSHYDPTITEIGAWLRSPAPRDAVYETRPRAMPRRQEPRAGVLRTQSNLFGGIKAQDILVTAGFTSGVAAAIKKNWGGITVQPGLFNVLGRAADASRVERVQVKPPETSTEHLLRLGWLRLVAAESDRVRLTPLGLALLRSAELDEEEAEQASVVVLGSNDALAYPSLIGHLAELGEGLLVDPYLRLEQLAQLVTHTRLDRLLVSNKDKSALARAAQIGVYLASSEVPRPVEVRASPDLHDRVVVADEGTIHTIGSSLNAIGRGSATVFTPLPAAAADALRDVYEQLWADADLVGSSANPDDPDEESQEDAS